MLTTGFTFRGVHSSTHGIVCDPTSRQLLPQKRREYIVIPGRSGVHVQSNGSFDVKTEQFKCGFLKNTEKTVSEMSRDIADWLSEDGLLEFDNEPGLFYNAFFSNAPPLEKRDQYAMFDLVFTYNPPFAFTAQHDFAALIASEANAIVVPVAGTAPTPVRIIIHNTGDTTINNLRITRYLL
ncbi:MAG TPA: phage tail family protein [Clostridia bacterium]|nr:phage tail family protein [Clostridia bacterium]